MSAFTRLYDAFAEGLRTRGEQNWEEVRAHAKPVEYHLEHAAVHIQAYLEGDETEDQIGHALGRLMMAAELLDDKGKQE